MWIWSVWYKNDDSSIENDDSSIENDDSSIENERSFDSEVMVSVTALSFGAPLGAEGCVF